MSPGSTGRRMAERLIAQPSVPRLITLYSVWSARGTRQVVLVLWIRHVIWRGKSAPFKLHFSTLGRVRALELNIFVRCGKRRRGELRLYPGVKRWRLLSGLVILRLD